jgi:coenzyme F420 hydrogenase subunit beta
MKGYNNIIDVIKSNHCVRCGGCIAICGKNAIHITYDSKAGFFSIRIEEEKCNQCGICLRVCPAYEFGERRKYFDINYHYLIGPFEFCLLAHASNEKIRYESSSGGIATAIISYLLEKKKIDEAYLVCAKHSEPFANRIILADHRILSESNREYASRYVQIPIADLLRNSKGKRIAIVGLPCQVIAARKISNLLGIDAIIIGIACSSGVSSNLTKHILREYRISHPRRIYYRGNGWPGKVRLEGFNKKGENRVIDEAYPSSRFMRLYQGRLFQNPACWLCSDHFGEFSDISLFDFWNNDRNDKIGETGIIIRTPIGTSLISELIESQRIEITKSLSPDEIIKSQDLSLTLKKIRTNGYTDKNAWARLLEIFIIISMHLDLPRIKYPKFIVYLISNIIATMIDKAKYSNQILRYKKSY